MTLAYHAVDTIDAVVEERDWAFAATHRAEIEAFWQAFATGKPNVFNGTVLVQSYGAIEGRTFRARYHRTDYKTFLAFLRLGHDVPGYRNGFGMAALRSSDGAFLLGEMAAGTANAGKIYFPAGTPDEGDIVDGHVDIAGSVLRELCEETGLRAEEVRLADGFTAVLAPKRVAFMKSAVIDLPAHDARDLMLDRMQSLHEDELANIVIIRAGDPLLDDPRIPDFVAGYIRRAFAEG